MPSALRPFPGLAIASRVRNSLMAQTEKASAVSSSSSTAIRIDKHSPPLQQPFRDIASILVALAPWLQLA
jgi:hypothetical protein